MKFIEELIHMRLYSTKTKIYAPISLEDKRRGSAILLFTKDQAESEKLMNLPYIYNPKYFTSYYISKNVNAYIEYEELISETPDDEEEPITESLVHENKDKYLKIKYDSSCTSFDIINLKKIYTADFIKDIMVKLRMKPSKYNGEITVYMFKDVRDIRTKFNNRHINSYAEKDAIYIVTESSYEKKSFEDGEYIDYVRHELVAAIIRNLNPYCASDIVMNVAAFMSGQYLNVERKDTPAILGAYNVSRMVSQSKGYAKIIDMIVDSNHQQFNRVMVKAAMDKSKGIINKKTDGSVRYESYIAPYVDSQELKNEEYVLTEDFVRIHTPELNMIYFFKENEDLLLEADKNDKIFKKFMYKERIKNNRQVLDIYAGVKNRNPWIIKTFLNLKQYRNLNTFIDLSYYNSLFIKNNIYKLKKGLAMYWDVTNRFLNTEEVSKYYSKQTIFIPVDKNSWGENLSVDAIMDFRQSINPISMIVRFMRTNMTTLQQEWGSKSILFVGSKGYFRVNFNELTMRNLMKFKSNITKLMSSEEIVEEDSEDDNIQANKDPDADSPAVITAKITDKIEDKLGIKLPAGVLKLGDDVRSTKGYISVNDLNHMEVTNRKIGIPENDEDKETGCNVYLLTPNGKSSENVILGKESLNKLNNFKTIITI